MTRKTPLVKMLLATLNACGKDRLTARRIENGTLHEDAITIALGDMAQKAGLPVEVVMMKSSSSPISDRNKGLSTPMDYRYRELVFLEADGQLLRLGLRDRGPGKIEQIVAFHHADRTTAAEFIEDCPYVEFSAYTDTHEPAGQTTIEGIPALSHLQEDFTRLRADHLARELDQASVPAKVKARKARL